MKKDEIKVMLTKEDRFFLCRVIVCTMRNLEKYSWTMDKSIQLKFVTMLAKIDPEGEVTSSKQILNEAMEAIKNECH